MNLRYLFSLLLSYGKENALLLKNKYLLLIHKYSLNNRYSKMFKKKITSNIFGRNGWMFLGNELGSKI